MTDPAMTGLEMIRVSAGRLVQTDLRRAAKGTIKFMQKEVCTTLWREISALFHHGDERDVFQNFPRIGWNTFDAGSDIGYVVQVEVYTYPSSGATEDAVRYVVDQVLRDVAGLKDYFVIVRINCSDTRRSFSS